MIYKLAQNLLTLLLRRINGTIVMDRSIFTVQIILAALMVFVVGGAPHDLPSVVLEGEPGTLSTGDVKWLPTPTVNT